MAEITSLISYMEAESERVKQQIADEIDSVCHVHQKLINNQTSEDAFKQFKGNTFDMLSLLFEEYLNQENILRILYEKRKGDQTN